MNHRRRLRLILIKIVLLATFLFIIILIGRHAYDKYTTERNISGMISEPVINGCDITICTPCQYLGPDESRENFKNDSNFAVQFIQYKEYPPPDTKSLEDFTKSKAERIEKILHQKWNTKQLPLQFKYYVKSFLDNHSSWQYTFWTDKSTRKFIKDHYPNLLFMYDSYVHPLNRADSMRYMILFYFGGVYSDLDMKSLRPLDPMIRKYSCFLAQEPHVHSIVYTNFYEQASNGLMGCRKRHPFMKSVLENLNDFFYYAHVLDSTGPRFLTFSFRQYMRKKSEIDVTDDDHVYLTPPEYFLPTVDPGLNGLLAMQCRGAQCLSPLRQWQCDQWRREGIRSMPYAFSFTTNDWTHIAYHDIELMKFIHISEICHGVPIYEYNSAESDIESIFIHI
ncbi:hypothetical protein ACJMK2_006396 [Sinanodonta woodiana]|uniref:Uncharacterized protein n=1 Tax=Sinanodonta woodiana TaxID=1069815 RepID=A0ABD3VT16_SINWO